MTAPALMTEAEAAKALSLCTRTLRNLRDQGQLNFVQIGRTIRYTPADLAQFIERNRVCPSTSEKARRSGSTRSPSAVFDFEEARAKRARGKRS